jgi:hypothetical protein
MCKNQMVDNLQRQNSLNIQRLFFFVFLLLALLAGCRKEALPPPDITPQTRNKRRRWHDCKRPFRQPRIAPKLQPTI